MLLNMFCRFVVFMGEIAMILPLKCVESESLAIKHGE